MAHKQFDEGLSDVNNFKVFEAVNSKLKNNQLDLYLKCERAEDECEASNRVAYNTKLLSEIKLLRKGCLSFDVDILAANTVNEVGRYLDVTERGRLDYDMDPFIMAYKEAEVNMRALARLVQDKRKRRAASELVVAGWDAQRANPIVARLLEDEPSMNTKEIYSMTVLYMEFIRRTDAIQLVKNLQRWVDEMRYTAIDVLHDLKFPLKTIKEEYYNYAIDKAKQCGNKKVFPETRQMYQSLKEHVMGCKGFPRDSDDEESDDSEDGMKYKSADHQTLDLKGLKGPDNHVPFRKVHRGGAVSPENHDEGVYKHTAAEIIGESTALLKRLRKNMEVSHAALTGMTTHDPPGSTNLYCYLNKIQLAREGKDPRLADKMGKDNYDMALNVNKIERQRDVDDRKADLYQMSKQLMSNACHLYRTPEERAADKVVRKPLEEASEKEKGEEEKPPNKVDRKALYALVNGEMSEYEAIIKGQSSSDSVDAREHKWGPSRPPRPQPRPTRLVEPPEESATAAAERVSKELWSATQSRQDRIAAVYCDNENIIESIKQDDKGDKSARILAARVRNAEALDLAYRRSPCGGGPQREGEYSLDETTEYQREKRAKEERQ